MTALSGSWALGRGPGNASDGVAVAGAWLANGR